MCLCTDDSRARRRTPSGELKDHSSSSSSEHIRGVEEEVHIRKKVGTSGVGDSRKTAAGKRVCFSTSPKRKSKPLSSSSPSKNMSQGAKQQRMSPRKKSAVPLSPLKIGGEGGRTRRERARSYSDGNVRFTLVARYACVYVYIHMYTTLYICTCAFLKHHRMCTFMYMYNVTLNGFPCIKIPLLRLSTIKMLHSY